MLAKVQENGQFHTLWSEYVDATFLEDLIMKTMYIDGLSILNKYLGPEILILFIYLEKIIRIWEKDIYKMFTEVLLILVQKLKQPESIQIKAH